VAKPPARSDLQRAQADHRAGRLSDAESGYRQILAKRPEDAQVLHLFGLLCGQSGRAAEGIALIERALAVDPGSAPTHYNLASLRLKSGETVLAESGYLRALELAPDYAAARFALASLLQGQGRGEEAISAYQAGLSVTPQNVAALNNLAGLLRVESRFEEAEACIGAALRIAPDYAEGHYTLGQLKAAREDWRQAAGAFTRCLALKPGWPPALFALAGAHQHLGDLEQAVGCLEEVLAATPQDPRAQHAMALLKQRQGELDAAAQHLRHAVSHDPKNLSALENLAGLALARGDPGELLDCHSRILALAPEDPDRWRAFVRALRLLRIEGFDPRLRDLLLVALKREDLDHQDLAIPAVSLLKLAPGIDGLLRLGSAASVELPQVASLPALEEPLLPVLLERVLIPDAELEAALVVLRRMLLDLAAAPRLLAVSPDILSIGHALATQCFLNEYLYAETDREQGALERLVAELGARGGPWDDGQSFRLAVLASYRCLHSYGGLDGCLAQARSSDDAAARKLIARQIDEPAEEARTAENIPSLGQIIDTVSQAVRSQYEENPYPRWHSLNRLPAKPLREVLPIICPALAGVEPLPPENPRVLIAGCGTGRHAIQAAELYQASELVAVDLSLASLAYAIRKARAYGIEATSFYQADILELPGQLDPFDVIESSGVLHHLADPLAGWRALARLLKPGGLMKLALYSEAARRHVVAARDFIADRGFPATARGIRHCRQEIFARAEDPAMAKLAAGRDFYSLSLCRDLIFHVQEHRFTLPQIGDAVFQLGLEFLGIEPQDQRQAGLYRVRFPGDPHLGSLKNWAEFEAEHPDSFAEMYHFWLRKPLNTTDEVALTRGQE
jgi:tetratricopeptide (TPR) repeat protein